jgi:hypothetical protein
LIGINLPLSRWLSWAASMDRAGPKALETKVGACVPHREKPRGSARRSLLPAARLMLGFLVASMTSACALVEKVGADGAIERSIAFLSPVAVVGGSPGAPRAVRVSAVGLGVGPDSAVLGAYEMSVVHLDPECRIVVMPARDVQLENFRRLLEQTRGRIVSVPRS